jgi:hypothetical protein
MISPEAAKQAVCRAQLTPLRSSETILTGQGEAFANSLTISSVLSVHRLRQTTISSSRGPDVPTCRPRDSKH